jgi:hypothetical protein
MVGHLMYELLTHGRLPYADIHDVTELAEKVCGLTLLPRIMIAASCFPFYVLLYQGTYFGRSFRSAWTGLVLVNKKTVMQRKPFVFTGILFTSKFDWSHLGQRTLPQ